MRSDVIVGTEIEGLRFDELAGRAGSSVVYRATDLATGEARAAKVLLAADDASPRRLAREADVLARIVHPAIVRFRGLFHTGDQAVLVTDRVDGETLLERLRRLGPIFKDMSEGFVMADELVFGPLQACSAEIEQAGG